MGGQVLDYEAKRIYKQAEIKANIKAVINMLSLGIDEIDIKNLYPEEFDYARKEYLASCELGNNADRISEPSDMKIYLSANSMSSIRLVGNQG